MTASTVSLIASLITPLIGRAVIATDKDGAESQYTISKLSDKLGTLKDGTKGEYVILTKDGELGVVMNLHPNTAKKLASKGKGDGFTLFMNLTQKAETQAEAMAEAEAEHRAELAESQGSTASTEPAATEAAAAAPGKAAKEPSKKDRTIAIFKSMAGSPRKDIIAALKTQLGLSDACCNTYYQNVKSGSWA
jgi:hypothetical protein